MAPDATRPPAGRQSAAAAARRAARLEEKRNVVLRATLDLIEEGELDPTIQQIVDRSGTPERSIFRYFDKGELAQRAFALAISEISHLGTIDDIGRGSFDARLERLVAARIRILERLKHLGRAARLRAITSPDLDQAMVDNAARLRDRYATHLAPEIDAIPDDTERFHVLDTITALLSFENFDLQRRRLGKSTEEIAATWTIALRRLLD